MTIEMVLAFCIGIFAIFVGGIILIVRIMVNRLIREYDKEVQRSYCRGYDQGYNDCVEGK